MDSTYDTLRAEPDNGVDSSPFPWPALLLVALLTFLLGGLGGYLLRGGQSPAVDSVDVGFARDMSLHHEQAVQMSALVYDRSHDPAVRSLAYDILTTQQGQIGIMGGWMDAWGVPWTSAGPRMVWMGMPVEGLMPGMATPEQMAALRMAEGDAADILFLQLMIPHHLAGVEMAEDAANRATQEPVRLLAASMAEAQQVEIDYMQELLAGKGQEAVPVEVLPAGAEGHDHAP